MAEGHGSVIASLAANARIRSVASDMTGAVFVNRLTDLVVASYRGLLGGV